MASGELYIKTQKTNEVLATPYVPSEDFTCECAYRRGIVVDGSNPFCGYADTFVRYGLSLTDGTIDKLETAAPMKVPVATKSAVRHGVSYNGMTVGIVDERTLSLEMHIAAKSRADYEAKYRMLRKEVLRKDGGVILLRTRREPDVCHRLLYQTHEQFRQWIHGGLAMFTLVFIEPHPELTELSPIPANMFHISMSPKPSASEEMTVMVGGSIKFTALTDFDASIITWNASDSIKAVKTSDTGDTATFSFISAGRVTITAYVNDSVKDECEVEIRDVPGPRT